MAPWGHESLDSYKRQSYELVIHIYQKIVFGHDLQLPELRRKRVSGSEFILHFHNSS